MVSRVKIKLILFEAEVSSCYKASSDSDLPDMTSIGEVVIAPAHVAVLPRPHDAETRWIAKGWSVVQLSLQVVTAVTPSVEVKVHIHPRDQPLQEREWNRLGASENLLCTGQTHGNLLMSLPFTSIIRIVVRSCRERPPCKSYKNNLDTYVRNCM